MTRLWIAGRHPSTPDPCGWELARALTNHLGVPATQTDHFGGGYFISTTASHADLEDAADLYLAHLDIHWEVRNP